MIYIKLTGGLGNQMFQYAAARWVKEVTGQEICLDYSDFSDYNNNHNATFENTLSNLNIRYASVIKHPSEFKNAVPELAKEYYKLYHKLNLVGSIFFFEGRIFIERMKQNEWNKEGLIFARDTYIPIYPENINVPNIVMSGFFQSAKYFPEQKKILQEEFKIIKPLSQENRKWIDIIQNSNSVCVHIRRGDYTKKGRLHCTESYYLRCVQEMKKRVSNPQFFVFSDDIKWVKENIVFDADDVWYVDENNDSCDEIRLMSSCSHFVISNSSFGWWAQYLSNNANKVVIAPRPWMRRIPTDIYLDNWVTIPVCS